MSDSRPTSTRRRALRFASLTGFSGLAGVTGLSLSSQPALALSGTVGLPSGLEEGSVTVPSYEIQYAKLDTASDITINYVLRTDAGTKTTESHVVSITESTGAVMTGDHLISVPGGEVTLEVQLEHPSVGTVSTQESAATTVAPTIPKSAILQLTADSLSLSDGQGVASWTDQIGGVEMTGGSPTYRRGLDLDPTVRSDGDDELSASQPANFPTGSNGRSVAIVHQYDANQSTNSGVLAKYGTQGSHTERFEVGVNRASTETFYVEIGGPGSYVETGPVYSDSGEYISFFIYPSGSGLSQSEAYINGSQASFDTNSTSTTPNTTSDLIEVFGMGGGRFLTGDASELVWYDSALSDSVRQDEELRLASKWGITL